jgi:hypothetical protein
MIVLQSSQTTIATKVQKKRMMKHAEVPMGTDEKGRLLQE